jgi:hypothetical protein
VAESHLRAFSIADVTDLDGVSDDHVRNTELLDHELPDPRFVDASYLHWLYDLNPFGRGIYANIDSDDDVRIAHYGLIPQEYRNAHERLPFVFSLNAVSRSGSQRRGLFSEIGQKVWGRAQEQGVQVVVGVTNANSTWPVKKLGWRVMGPLPVQILAPRLTSVRNVRSYDITPAFLESELFDTLVEGLDESPAWHWTNCWTAEHLRWRLAAPNGARYTIHVSPELVGVSTITHSQGVPFAVVLKLLPRGGRFGPIPSHEIVTAMCRHHRAPLAVYAGHNRHVVVRGPRLPEPFKPVPLNLVMLSLTDRVDQHTFQLDTFEFLDMDAY